MAVTVRIPTTMRPLTDGDKQVAVEPGTLNDIVSALEAAHPGMGERLVDEDGGGGVEPATEREVLAGTQAIALLSQLTSTLPPCQAVPWIGLPTRL